MHKQHDLKIRQQMLDLTEGLEQLNKVMLIKEEETSKFKETENKA